MTQCPHNIPHTMGCTQCLSDAIARHSHIWMIQYISRAFATRALAEAYRTWIGADRSAEIYCLESFTTEAQWGARL
jgi:hypothetical protein